MTARLPVPGSDNDTWGTILNTFLEVSHNSDGTLQSSAVTQAGAIPSSQVGAANGVASLNGSGKIPTTQLGSGTGSASNYLRGDGTWAVPAGSGVSLDTTASDIQSLGAQAAGSTGKAADAGHVHPTTGLAVLSGSTFTGYVAPAAVALTFGTTITVNASSGNAFNLTLTASTGTIANPTNPTDGQVIRLRLVQDSTGGRTVSWGSAYDFGSGVAPTLSTGANKVDIVSFEYVSSISKWCWLGAGLGY